MAGNDLAFDAVRTNRAAGAGAWLPLAGVTHARRKRSGMGGARSVRIPARMENPWPERRIFADSARSGVGAGSRVRKYGSIQLQRVEKIVIRHIRTTPDSGIAGPVRPKS